MSPRSARRPRISHVTGFLLNLIAFFLLPFEIP
jgi:hypothetical protein